ncbi:MAG: 30S ribosomal protein S6 [Limnochordales bacterium]|nr:MAG: 30S ribosomal protein S6 [Bacillota bacterium]HLT58110.1 30S ribosomal protein S6 [Limnochordales bacterium]
MRPYEAMVVLEPGLDEEALEAALERFAGAVTGQGGQVTHIDRWGKRRLAYEIAGHTEGYYALLKFEGSPAAAIELDRILRITDGVLRHLIVREEKKRTQGAAGVSAAAAAPAAEEAAGAAETGAPQDAGEAGSGPAAGAEPAEA